MIYINSRLTYYYFRCVKTNVHHIEILLPVLLFTWHGRGILHRHTKLVNPRLTYDVLSNLQDGVLIVKICAWVLPVDCREHPHTREKKLAESLVSHLFFCIFGGEKGNCIVMKICIGVIVPDIITHANFRDYRFKDFWGSGVEFPIFSLT